jgi:hypothetical protein
MSKTTKTSKAKKPAKRKPGRPTKYTAALARMICRRLAEGESLRKICADEKMPAISTVMLWLFDGEHEEFSERYARAREAQAEIRADEIVDIADDSVNDTMTDEDGKTIVNYDHIQRSRLRVDARKWVAAKLLPKRYGDKVAHSGEITVRHEDALQELE